MYDKNKGYEYEKVARRYLLSNGYTLLEENFSCRLGEIDIIASKESRIHFVEVKGRKNTEHGYPREAVTAAKQKKIISAAKYYLAYLNSEDLLCQFDVIEIIADNREINFIENAFWN